MTKLIKALMRDVDNISAEQLMDRAGRASLLRNRIEATANALVGTARSPDTGPWNVSEDGRTISSDDFTHDVVLRVDGDFYCDEDRRAYSVRLAQRLNGIQKEPPAGLLASMATRYRHDFGLLSAEEQEALLRIMRQLYEEVAGQGFYRWE